MIFNFLACLLVGVSAFAQTRPLWTAQTPEEKNGILYFVGRSPPAANEVEGVKTALKDAREQLLRQEFGTSIKIDSTHAETLKEVSLDSKLSEVSELILLKGFRQLEVYVEEVGDKKIVWGLYSAERKEIDSERLRMDELKKQRQSLQHSIPNTPSVAFNNGGKPKIRKGLKKSDVVALFGTPKSVQSDYDGKSLFVYQDTPFCEGTICFINFSSRGQVNTWSSFKPEYTTDLDDVVHNGKNK